MIQKYLRNEFETIDEYNAQAGELAEPYRFLVIADFPVGFDAMIRSAGSTASPPAARAAASTRSSPTIAARRCRMASHLDDLDRPQRESRAGTGRFMWRDEVFEQFPLTLDAPPAERSLTAILTDVGEGCEGGQACRSFFRDDRADRQMNSGASESDNELHVAIGRMGATRLQMFRLGRGVAQHCADRRQNRLGQIDAAACAGDESGDVVFAG